MTKEQEEQVQSAMDRGREATNHAIDNAKSWLESIAEALEAYHKARGANGDDEWGKVEFDGEELTADGIQQRIEEMPLEIAVRSDWHTPGTEAEKPEEYRILLTTGGPALRIIGELDEYSQPESARLEWQDWGTRWTKYHTTTEQEEQLIEFARFFYFGE